AQGDNLSTQNGTKSVTITGGGGGGPDRLAISAGPASVTTSDCSLYTVQSRDSGNNPAAVTLASDVDLTDGSSGIFYGAGDVSCTTPLAPQRVNIPVSSSSIQFRYKKVTTTGSPVTLTATDVAAQGDNLSTQNGTKSVTVTSGGPDRLAISAGPASATTSDCSLYTVEARDAANNPAGVTAATEVDLTDPGDSDVTGFFYNGYDNTCTSPMSPPKLHFAYNNSSMQFRYKKTTTVGSPVTLTAIDVVAQGDNLSTQNGTKSVTVTSGGGLADRVTIPAGPVTIDAGECAMYTVQARDSSNNPANVISASEILLDDSGDSDNSGYFYSQADSTCLSPLSPAQVSITAATSSQSFRYKKATTAGSPVTISATDGTGGDYLGYGSGFLNVTINSTGGGSGASHSLVVGIGGTGTLWQVTADSNKMNYWLAKYSAQGVAIASTALSGFAEGFEVDISFDAANFAYALGAVDSAGDVNVKIVKVDSDGSGVVASTIYDSAGGSEEDSPFSISSDPAGNLWVTGAVQYNISPPRYKMFIHKYDSNLAAAGGFPKLDAPIVDGSSIGLDIAVTANNVWVVGVASGAVSGLYDLVVWKYDLAGNFVSSTSVAGYYDELSILSAKLLVADGKIFVATAKMSAAVDKNKDLAFLKFNQAPTKLIEVFWHNEVLHGGDIPSAIAMDGSGNLLVSGVFDEGTGSEGAVLWKYDQVGNLSVGFPQKTGQATDFAHGMVIDGSGNTWISLEASTSPTKFISGSAVGGATGLDSVGGNVAPDTLVVSGPGSINAGQCSAYTVETTKNGSNVGVSAATIVGLSDGANGAFYTSAGCSGSSVADINFAVGEDWRQVYYINPTAGGVTLAAA
ncbi:MAG: hypothetical protein AABZ44_09750, partial [Elusimicrobiota bacterium]